MRRRCYYLDDIADIPPGPVSGSDSIGLSQDKTAIVAAKISILGTERKCQLRNAHHAMQFVIYPESGYVSAIGQLDYVVERRAGLLQFLARHPEE